VLRISTPVGCRGGWACCWRGACPVLVKEKSEGVP